MKSIANKPNAPKIKVRETFIPAEMAEVLPVGTDVSLERKSEKDSTGHFTLYQVLLMH